MTTARLSKYDVPLRNGTPPERVRIICAVRGETFAVRRGMGLSIAPYHFVCGGCGRSVKVAW